MFSSLEVIENFKFTHEGAKGGGNCAFNAYTLGLCDPLIFNWFAFMARDQSSVPSEQRRQGFEPLNQKFQRFIPKAALALRQYKQFPRTTDPEKVTWDELSKKLLSLDRAILQDALRPVMRELAVELMRSDLDFAEITLDPLLSAFNNTFVTVKGAQDDIFTFDFIKKDKFNELKRKYKDDLANASLELMDWWRKTGAQKFLDKMSEEGEMGGDLEIVYFLPKYFGVNVAVIKNDQLLLLGRNNNGYFDINDLFSLYPPDSSKDIELTNLLANLSDRQLTHPKKELELNVEFSLVTRSQWEKRLSAVPQLEDVLKFVEDNKNKSTNRIPKDIFIPKNWSVDCKFELEKRGIINSDGKMNTLEISEIKKRINDIDKVTKPGTKALLLNIYGKYYIESPILVFEHEGAHWDNVRITPKVLTPKQTIPPATSSTVPTPTKVTAIPPATTTTQPAKSTEPPAKPRIQDVRGRLIDVLEEAIDLLEQSVAATYPEEYAAFKKSKATVQKTKKEEPKPSAFQNGTLFTPAPAKQSSAPPQPPAHSGIPFKPGKTEE